MLYVKRRAYGRELSPERIISTSTYDELARLTRREADTGDRSAGFTCRIEL